eukprot:gnl/MRDRNA2_/MRDRNA2_70974_c0_seq1.p1 gnl/MRDRNA2_/MRDRNA2_70974_c0~~gnl/MRDRNA2_/MRDRNA2_70974_c0_seq1.p1  ORF type:complete len:650 (+),score=98.68 gnl/MRDRNA2_/MRDRNA2_70974_c0_seq1:99-2048(+)
MALRHLLCVLLTLPVSIQVRSASAEVLQERHQRHEHWIVQPRGSSTKVQAQMRRVRGEQRSSVVDLLRADSTVHESGLPTAMRRQAARDQSSSQSDATTAAPDSSSSGSSSNHDLRYMDVVKVVYAGDHRPEEDMTLYKQTDAKTQEVGIFVEKVKLDSEADLMGVRDGFELIAVVKDSVEDSKLFKEGTVEELWEGMKLPVELIFGRPPPGRADLYIAGTVVFLLVAGIAWCILSNLRNFWDNHSFSAEEDADGERQIGRYNASKLTHCGTLLRLFARGSLFVSTRVWSQVAGYVFVWLLLTLFFCWIMKDASKLDDSALSSLSSYLNAFMPFFFAMYLSAVFDRWWGIRTEGIGRMWNVVDDLGMIMTTSLIGDKEQFSMHRKAQLRYGMLSQTLIFQQARQQVDLMSLKQAGLLTETEQETLDSSPGDKSQSCWVWILDLWTDILKQKAVSDTVHQSVLEYCVEGRRAAQTAMTYITCQVPYGWVHLITVMVNVTVIILVMKCSIVCTKNFSKRAHSRQPCTVTENGMQCSASFTPEIELFCQIIELILIPLIFIGFLEFTNEMGNPFGVEPSDFPRLQYLTGMRNENEGFFMVTGKGSMKGLPEKHGKSASKKEAKKQRAEEPSSQSTKKEEKKKHHEDPDMPIG